MDTKTLAEFITWSKTTDLEEITYNKAGTYVQIKTAQAAAKTGSFACRLTPVKAPAVGIYHAGAKGKALNLKEDMPLKEGQTLGYIEMNKTQKPVLAPKEGALKIISIEDGQSAQYGQPLFFIEPKI
ncbi:MAG: hypothetical protein LBR90_01040 [Elusimicrobiota bacterium]|jgi:biotin carboxyl carrier protein|nr:hypothetical protein [Elusimicrobiota bacterium]